MICKNRFLDILTTMETYRSQNLIIYEQVCPDSYVLVDKTYVLHLDPVFGGKTDLIQFTKNNPYFHIHPFKGPK